MSETDHMTSTQEVESPKSRHSKWTYASNSFFQFPSSLMGFTQVGFLFFYYEVVIGLNAWLIFLALSIFTIYDALNDPLIGFLVDRNTRLTRKWGRRFPWIVIGIIPWSLSIYLLYSAPNVDVSTNPWPIFGWLLMSLFLYDTFGSLVLVNTLALRPDKFRTEEERQILAAYYTPIDIIAIGLGMLLPPLFLGSGDNKAGFALMGGAIAIISLIGAILYLPGAREDKIIIDRYFSSEYKRMNFFQGTKEALKLRSFIIYFIMATCFGVAMSLMVANVVYLTTFVLQTGPDMSIIIFSIFLMGAMISVPFWLKYLKKIKNNKKVFTVGGFAFSAALIPMTFFQGLIDLLIIVFILGFAMGSMWAFLFTIILPNVVDDFVVQTGKNQKGILLGIFVLLSRLVATIDDLIFAIVHGLTGFEPGHETYDELATAVPNINLVLIGIRLLSGVIPALIIFAGTLIFWKFFPLTQDVVLKNKAELEKLRF